MVEEAQCEFVNIVAEIRAAVPEELRNQVRDDPSPYETPISGQFEAYLMASEHKELHTRLISAWKTWNSRKFAEPTNRALIANIPEGKLVLFVNGKFATNEHGVAYWETIDEVSAGFLEATPPYPRPCVALIHEIGFTPGEPMLS